MRNIRALFNQVKGLHRRIPTPAQPAPQLVDAFHFHLFTEDEQERLHALTRTLQPKITGQGRRPGVAALTIAEKDEILTWIHLQQALDSEDVSLAGRARHYLRLSQQDKERLCAAFLALDGSCLPDVSHCIDAPTIKWDGRPHYIYQLGLRWQQEHTRCNHTPGDYLRWWDIDTMWMWMEVCSQYKSRQHTG